MEAYDAIIALMAALGPTSPDFQKKFEEKNMALEMARARVKDEAAGPDQGLSRPRGDRPREVAGGNRVGRRRRDLHGGTDGDASRRTMEEGGRAASADAAYLGFYAEWIILEAIRAYAEAVVPTEASAYPGTRKVDREEIEKMGMPTPSTYPDIMAVYKRSFGDEAANMGRTLEMKLKEIAGRSIDTTTGSY